MDIYMWSGIGFSDIYMYMVSTPNLFVNQRTNQLIYLLTNQPIYLLTDRPTNRSIFQLDRLTDLSTNQPSHLSTIYLSTNQLIYLLFDRLTNRSIDQPLTVRSADRPIDQPIYRSTN